MNSELHQKVTAGHLKREAYLYVRQSTLRQVFENTESTKRQYALRERAVALGWPLDRVVVIDSDLGQSGADSDRAGFQQLVAAVGLGQVGVVLGLEVSRLARNSADWHRLLEICALTNTLILDEDGLYNPAHFNDRLLLGLKGTMSEAELHVLRARLQGGILNKASRGELEMKLPVGLVYGPDGRVSLDPDQQVQAVLRTFFATFGRTGSARATVHRFQEQGLLFPQRVRSGPRKGELAWSELSHARTLDALHNPRYAGAFAYGRSQTRKTVTGRTAMVRLPREEWTTLIRDAHPGYISFADYEENLRRLQANSQAQTGDRRRSPPREGCAVLQGLVLCGLCGRRMTVGYRCRGGRVVPYYSCQSTARAGPLCQRLPGWALDEAIADLLVEAVTPLALEVALAVREELAGRAEEADRLRRQQVERARYEAELAQRRYLRVDPDHRLVADSLEADWNQKLRELAAAQQEYERQRRDDGGVLVDERQRAEILALATDFPRLWRDPATSDRDRKRMVRLILEDVTLVRTQQIVAQIRFRGGATRTVTVPVPAKIWLLRQTPAEVVHEVDRLLDHHTDGEVANILNQRGLRPGMARAFTRLIVADIRRSYNLADRFTRLRKRGLLTQGEMAAHLGVHVTTLQDWQKSGRLASHIYNDKHQRLYEHPVGPVPTKFEWQQRPRRQTELPAQARNEVYSDA